MRVLPLLLILPLISAEAPVVEPTLDGELAAAESKLVIRCAQLSKPIYLQDMSCRVCQVEGPLQMAMICTFRGE